MSYMLSHAPTHRALLTDDAVRDRQSRHHTRRKRAHAGVPTELVIGARWEVVMLPLALQATHERALW